MPNDSVTPLDVAIDLGQLAAFLSRGGKKTEALPYALRSVEIRRKLLATDPNDARMQGRLLFALNLEGFIRRSLGRTAEAKLDYEETRRIATTLLAADPAIADVLRNLHEAASALVLLGGSCEVAQQARATFKVLESKKLLFPNDRQISDGRENFLRTHPCAR